MSDLDNKLESQLSQLPSDPAPVIPQPAAEPAVNKVKPTTKDIQTADTTCFNDPLPARSQSLGTFDAADAAQTINGFIGLNKESYDRVNTELELWQGYVGAKEWARRSDRERAKEGITQSQIQAQIAAWEEYCAVNIPGQDIDTINKRQRTIYAFITNLADPLLLQYPVVREKGLSNVSQRANNFITGDIYGLVPSMARQKFALSEFMRRTSMSANKEPYNYDLLLRNSYIAFRYAKPTRLEVGALLDNIARAVRGHVRSVSQNLPALSNVAVIRVLWGFIRDRIIHCSVKDTSDFDELADVVRITDANTLATSLLALVYPQGVNFDLNCLGAKHCGWQKNDIIDPTSLLIDRKWLDTAEEAAAYANMMNFSRKYSREESLKFIKNTNFMHDIQPVWNGEQTACFILGVPSLTESFEAEEFFANLIQDNLNKLREEAMTEEQYFAARDEFLNGLVGTDYLHYISEYHIMPAPGTDDEPVKILRSESDPKEFNQGIVNIIQDNEEMATNLVKAVITHYPFMSKTFVGMANYACEKCAATSEAYEDLGYTPINVISTFFTLANLTYIGRSRVGENARDEALLAISQ